MKRYLKELASAEMKRNAKNYYSDVNKGKIGELANTRITMAMARHELMTDHELARIIIKAYDQTISDLDSFRDRFVDNFINITSEYVRNGEKLTDEMSKSVEYFDKYILTGDKLFVDAFGEYFEEEINTDLLKAAFTETELYD